MPGYTLITLNMNTILYTYSLLLYKYILIYVYTKLGMTLHELFLILITIIHYSNNDMIDALMYGKEINRLLERRLCMLSVREIMDSEADSHTHTDGESVKSEDFP